MTREVHPGGEERCSLHTSGDGERKEGQGTGEAADLKEGHHVVGAELQVDPSDGDVLPGGSVSSQVHRHQLIQASA